MGYVVPVDSTRFVTASIKEVKSTLIEAMVLVIAVVFCFAKLARHADSDGGGADFADWHFCRAVAVWVFHQHADLVLPWCWPSASWWMTPLWCWKTSNG